MKHKLFSALLALTLLCGAVALPASAAEDTDSSAYLYDTLPDGTICITGVMRAMYAPGWESLTIPEQIDGKTVTEINFDNGLMERLTLPDSVTSILKMPDTVRKVVLSKNLKRIGAFAFWNCTKLTELTLPDSLEEIDDYAFAECRALLSLHIPRNVKKIGRNILYPYTDRRGFWGGTVRLTVAKDNPYFQAKRNVLFTKDGKTLLYCIPAKHGDYTVPKSVETIAPEAFFYQQLLSEIRLRKGVKKIGERAFFLQPQRIILPDGIEEIGAYAFACATDKKLRVPNSLRFVGKRAFAGTAVRSASIPAQATVRKMAFQDCKSLKTLTIGKNAKIGKYAFFGCKKLKTVRIAKGVTLGTEAIGRYGQEPYEDDSYSSLYDSKNVRDITIYGYRQSSAQRYAKKYKMRFVPFVSLKNATVKGVVDKTYTKAVKQSGAKQRVKVSLKGKKLQKGRDYTVTYKHNKARGKATVIVTGLNRYDGVLKRTFQIR